MELINSLNQIILGDSIELIKKYSEGFFHSIISDIPYGISFDNWDVLHNNTNSALGGSSLAQKKAGSVFKRRGKPLNGWSQADKQIPFEYQQWCAAWADGWLRVLKPGGSCFVLAGRRFSHRCIVAFEDCGFIFKDMLAWEKTNAVFRAQRLSEIYKRRNDFENAEKYIGWRVGNLCPIFEPILWFQKPYKIGTTLADNVLINGVGAWKEGLLESNLIKVQQSSLDNKKHPTQKPIELMKILIELVTQEGDIILDPFCGSGTTCLAAKILNRNYIGIEKEEGYFNIARERIGGN